MNLNQQLSDELLTSLREEFTQMSREFKQLTQLMPEDEKTSLSASDNESLLQAMEGANTQAQQAGKERAEAVRRSLAHDMGMRRPTARRINRMTI